MTREEAIMRLKEYAQYSYGIWHNEEEDTKAFDIAIEALQNLSKPNNGLQGSTLISRQDAIEAIAKRIYHIEDGNENDALRKAICDIDALPSVNAIPYDSTVTLNSPTIIKATSTDLISRQDAIDTVEELNRKVNDGREFDTICTSDVIRRINALPSAEPKREECEEREQGLCPFYAG